MDQSQIVGIGMIIIFIGIIVIFSSMFFQSGAKTDTKFSVFGIFGFIPFGFSNDKKLFIFSIILTVVIILVSLFLFYKRIK